MSGNAVLYFHPEGFSTSAPKLMGRHAAGEGFLAGWVRHGGFDLLHCQVGSRDHLDPFKAVLQNQGWQGQVRVHWLEKPETMADPGAVILPGPDLSTSAWQRRSRASPAAYSIIGLTHTTASHGALNNITELLTGPVEPWDALICTSDAVKQMVVRTLEEQAAYLRQRLGVPASQPLTLPQLPVIPLGVECDRFAANPALRDQWRQELGIEPQDVVVLFMGRLSFHAKAHPMAMYAAMQAACPSLPQGARLHLIEAGWFGNDGIRQAFAEAAQMTCPGVVRHVLDGREPNVRNGIWHAADIFCSLSDNIQETFGLTPIEAMAAGLPCVVTDWNGYKDTVRDGVDGFRIQTWMPPAPFGREMAERHAAGLDNYDMYCGLSCQFVSVDIDHATRAFAALIADPALRHRMGEAARRRAREQFDWRVVVAAYKRLVADLSTLRPAAAAPLSLLSPGAAWPARPDPFWSFAHYPTHLLTAQTQVQATDLPAARLEAIYATGSVRYAAPMLPPMDIAAKVLEMLRLVGPQTIPQLVQSGGDAIAPGLPRTVLFLAKYGFVRLTPSGNPQAGT